jgi:chromosome segregation ATPase
MTTDYERNNNRSDTAWERMRNMVGIGLLMFVCYQAGLAHGRGDKAMNQYTALKAQYQRIEAEYSSLKTQYDGLVPQYAAMRERCENTAAEYVALKAQYDRIEARRAGNMANKSNQ